MTLLPYALWYADELRAAKQTKRRHERKWKKSQLEVDRQIYAKQCKTYTRMLEQAKCEHHRSKISECDDRQLFRVVDKMSRPVAASAPTLPSHNDARSSQTDSSISLTQRSRSSGKLLMNRVVQKSLLTFVILVTVSLALSMWCLKTEYGRPFSNQLRNHAPSILFHLRCSRTVWMSPFHVLPGLLSR